MVIISLATSSYFCCEGMFLSRALRASSICDRIRRQIPELSRTQTQNDVIVIAREPVGLGGFEWYLSDSQSLILLAQRQSLTHRGHQS